MEMLKLLLIITYLSIYGFQYSMEFKLSGPFSGQIRSDSAQKDVYSWNLKFCKLLVFKTIIMFGHYGIPIAL